jgi:WD40 repeat protein
MTFTLLLTDPRDPLEVARPVTLQSQVLQTSPGGEDITVSFQPNRTDDLYFSAKSAAPLAYRILFREGIVRSQVVVRFRLGEARQNVVGRSADLLFALAIILPVYEERGLGTPAARSFPSLAATGVLETDGTVRAVDQLPSKLQAACDAFDGEPATIFFPADNAAEVDLAVLSQQHPKLRLRPIGHLDQALEQLGIVLERVYLRNPFRGLEYFEYQHRAIFFGRDREIREVVEQLLRREAMGFPGMLVEGASGSGKSSFMRAGLLPALVNPSSQGARVAETLRRCRVRDSVRHAIWRPGHLSAAAEEQQIAQSILECWRALPEFAGKLPLTCDSLTVLADERERHWPATQRFVWVIDQFEGLFALGFQESVIDAIARFLVRLQSGGVWTLGCIRADAVPQLKQHATLRQVFGANEGQYYLETMRGTALDDVIARPAQAAGLTFGSTPSGQPLDQLVRQELYATRENTLPLLQFTLQELYQRRSGTVLQYETYERLGGLSGSVAAAAEAALQDLESVEVLPRIFRSLVSVDDEGRPSKRYAPVAEIASVTAQRKLLDRLVSARLCVTDEQKGTAVVAFAHEALLRTWPRLRDWLTQEGTLLQTRELAQRDTRLWLEHGGSNAWLAGVDKVVAFGALDSSLIPLPAEVRSFIDRSRRHVRRTTHIKRAVVGLIALLAVAASIGAFVASRKEREAQYQTAQAHKAQLLLLTQVAAERLNAGDVTLARGIILEVLRHVPKSERPDPEAVNVFQEVRANDLEVGVLTGHTAPVRRVAYSPDGSRIVTASNDGTARIWDARTGLQLRVLTGHAQEVRSAVYSPDGRELVTGSLDGTARTWDAGTGAQRLVLHHARIVACASFSPDGKRILTAGDSRWRIWDAASGAPLAEFSGDRSGCARYSPDGTRIVMPSGGAVGPQLVRIWDARTGTQLAALSGHTAAVFEASFSPNGHQVVTASKDGTARTWDARTGAPLLVLDGHHDEVTSAVYSPDGARIATTSNDKTVRIWDATKGTLIKVLTGHVDMIADVAYSPDGTRLVTGGWDSVARLWDLTGGTRPLILSGHAGDVISVAYSPDGLRLATASADRTARIWNARTGAQLAVLSGHTDDVNSVAYSRDGSYVVTASDDKTVRVWDAATAAPLLTVPTVGPVSFASYSPDGQRIVGIVGPGGFDPATRGPTIVVWDAHTGSQLARGSTHDRYAIGALLYGGTATYSPDGSRILTGSIDKTARVWDAETLLQLAVLPHSDMVNTAFYSPDGMHIVTSTVDKNASVWDSTSATRIGVLQHRGPVNCAVFSPNGSRIATGSADSTVRIWDAHSLIQLAVFTGHGEGGPIAWSPDSAHLAGSADDHTTRIWEASDRAELPAQILWAEAAETDPLSDVQRTQLGILPGIWPLGETTDQREPTTLAAEPRPTPCDVQAGAYYDPDRRAPGLDEVSINADLASASCGREVTAGAESRTIYQAGRAAWAKGQVTAARQYLERSVHTNYAAARVDLALLLSDPSAGMLDPDRAVSLLKQAWEEGVLLAGFELGALYENGVATTAGAGQAFSPDPGKAWFWYQEGANRGEPRSLARLAQRAETDAVLSTAAPNDAQLLTAFTLYARATLRAEAMNWPVTVWRSWRYRRSTLARLLAADGMMQEVANAYESVLHDSIPET